MTGNSYDEANLSYVFFTCEQVKKTILDFLRETVRV